MSVLVGKQAPDFTVPAVLGDGTIVDDFNLSEAIKGKYRGNCKTLETSEFLGKQP